MSDPTPKQQALAALALLKHTLELVEDTDTIHFRYESSQPVVPKPSSIMGGPTTYTKSGRSFFHAVIDLELVNKEKNK